MDWLNSISDDLLSAVPPEWRPVVANHKKESAGIRTLRRDADLGRPYSMVSMTDLPSLMRKGGYDLSKFLNRS